MKRISILAFAILLIAGCTYHAPPGDVDKAAAEFFLRAKSHDYDKIYDDAAAPFKDQNPRVEALESFRKFIGYGRPARWERISMSFADEGKWHVAQPVYMVQTDNITSKVSLKFGDANGVWRFMGMAIAPHGASDNAGQ
ncbi:MAG TPA: hypothetical protein VJX67_10870 [Blastocatellia bacterium]|nr:hypothetical protein [Blastocatellia bacterium]